MRGLVFTILFICFYSGTLVSCKPNAIDFIVYKKGEIETILILPDKPKGIETKAATLFGEQFNRITGVNLKMISEKGFVKKANQVPVFIGNTTAAQKANALYEGNDDGFILGEKEGSVFLHAKKGLGILNAVSTFFEDYTHSIYLDYQERFTPQLDEIKIPGSEITSHTPAFEFRQAYFPQSQDYDYANWNKLHLLQENWAIWGHNLHRLIEPSLLQSANSGIFATVNGQATSEQYCFSSEALAQSLIKGITQKRTQNPDAIYYSIAPNDNALVCGCSKCVASNGGTSSSTNSVVTLINRLAKQFPDLIFSTHAYLSTLNAPKGLKMADNSLVLISTIDFPKGIPISESKQADKFKTLLSSWKNACRTLYIWDYTVQYTNYFDFFPNLPALQKDLLFFKENGIRGVLEQGSEDQYSLFGEWKSFAISKLLWKPDINLDTLRYSFFELAYPSQVDFLTDYLTPLDGKQLASKKSLNIYGTVNESTQSYLNIEEFDLFFYELTEKCKESSGKEKERLDKVILALSYLKLELCRSAGVSAYGYGQTRGDSIVVHNEIGALLNRIADLSSITQVKYTGETMDSLSAYRTMWESQILRRSLHSKLIDKPIKYITPPNGEFKGNAKSALTDGAVGFLDYETNWLLFNSKTMQVEIPSVGLPINTLDISFLNNPRHLFLAPDKVSLFAISPDGARVLLAETALNRPSGKQIARVKLNIPNGTTANLVVMAEYTITYQDYTNSTRKPSIACDELFLY
jgi:hypothetical protein